MPGPRLTHNSRMILMFIYEKSSVSIWTSQYRLFLISRRFVDSCFLDCKSDNKSTIIGLDLELHELQIYPYWRNAYWAFRKQDFSIMFNIIKLAHFSAISINVCSTFDSPVGLNEFKQLCGILKGKPELEHISFTTFYSSYELFIDLLPPKIYQIFAHTLNFPLYTKLTSPLHSFCLDLPQGKQPNYQLILKTPAKIIEFVDNWECDLIALQKCGPFDPNPHLETLLLPVDISEFRYFNPDHDKWLKEQMPLYRHSLEYIQQINGNVKVKSEKDISYLIDVVKYKYAFKLHKDVMRRVHAIIDIAHEMNVNLQIKGYHFHRDYYQERSRKACRRFAKLTGMKRFDYFVEGQFEYRACKFTLSYAYECFSY